MDNNTWRVYVKKIQLAYIAHGHPITYQQALIIAREYYEKGLELEKQKQVPIKEEFIPDLKTVNKKKKKEEEDNVEVVKKKKTPPKKKKIIEVSDSESDSEDEEYKQYLKLKRKYNKNKKIKY